MIPDGAPHGWLEQAPSSEAAPTLRLRRTLRPADRDAVRTIVASTGRFRPAEIDVAVELVDERLARGRASGYEFVLADAQDQTVGYACYGPITVTEGSYDLFWIAVHRAWQRHGLGRQLLAEAEADIRQAGGRRIYIETSGRPDYEPTRHFYQRCGYTLEATIREFYAPGDDKLIYVKSLRDPR
jgi:ribosomal protein S18 acetylase RimI-like enzyme